MFRLLRRLRWILALLAIGLGGVHQLRQHEALFPRAEPYERGLYKHWTDADGDCQNTRTEALIRDSLEPVTLSADGCSVVYGRWQDPFTGAILIDPGMLDIDHMVPLAEAHRSGADLWQGAKREAYANDLSFADSLAVVTASENRSKADRDPLSWLPSNPLHWCDYSARWVRVKAHWGLQSDPPERWWLTGLGWVCGFKGPKQ